MVAIKSINFWSSLIRRLMVNFSFLRTLSKSISSGYVSRVSIPWGLPVPTVSTLILPIALSIILIQCKRLITVDNDYTPWEKSSLLLVLALTWQSFYQTVSLSSTWSDPSLLGHGSSVVVWVPSNHWCSLPICSGVRGTQHHSSVACLLYGWVWCAHHLSNQAFLQNRLCSLPTE